MIHPTVSRAVWFRPGPACGIPVSDQPLHATIVRVINDRCVNLLVVNGHDGAQFFKPAVQLVQHGDKLPNDGPFCIWPEHTRPPIAPQTVSKASDETVHDGTTLREPVNLEHANPGNTEPAPTDATLDAAQKSDATAPVETAPADAEMKKDEAGALSS